jgi:ketosteroid isomerase-like protein
MRRLLPVVGLAFAAFAASCAPPAPPTPAKPSAADMVAAADALDRQFLDAFNRADVDAMMATYWNSPDVVSFSPEGMGTKGWTEIKTASAEMFKGLPGARLEFLESHNNAIDDVVLGWGRWKIALTTPQGPQVVEGRYSDVKAMRDGKMVYLMDHASAPLPPPPAEKGK